MANTDYKSVDEYIEAQPKPAQSPLEKVRRAIRKIVPEAEERISYQIPAYKMPGGRWLYFAAWKEHYSLYPATRLLLAEFQDELAEHEVRKSTIRFSLAKPVPVKLIERIAAFRAQEPMERRKAKSAAAKPPRKTKA